MRKDTPTHGDIANLHNVLSKKNLLLWNLVGNGLKRNNIKIPQIKSSKNLDGKLNKSTIPDKLRA